jgi:hypothetical protein
LPASLLIRQLPLRNFDYGSITSIDCGAKPPVKVGTMQVI